jgi:hypothetical protein
MATPLFIILGLVFFTSCSSSEKSISFEDKMLNKYRESNRVNRFYELQERYDNSRLVLFLNTKQDQSWIVNYTAWIASKIIDFPAVCSTGSILGIIYLIAWWIGVVLTGGGILAVLAYVGSLLGGVPGIPPAILGILYLCILFGILYKLFGLIFN